MIISWHDGLKRERRYERINKVLILVLQRKQTKPWVVIEERGSQYLVIEDHKALHGEKEEDDTREVVETYG